MLNTEQLRGVELVDSVAWLCSMNLLLHKQSCTTNLWIYDLRKNLHFTLKENQLKRADIDEFVACYSASDRTKRMESKRSKSFTHEKLLKRDKGNLGLFWPKDGSLEDSAYLPDPGVLALDISEDLEEDLA